MNYYNRREKAGICVVKRKNESDEDFIRRFRKKFSKSGIMREYKEKMYFEKPSDKKRRKRAQSALRRKQEDEKREKYLKKKSKTTIKKESKNVKNY